MGNAKLRPLKSAETKRTCTLSGVQGKLYSDKLITLKDIEKSLGISIAEAEAAAESEAFWGRMTIAAKFVKIGCDLTLGIMSELPGAGISGKAVSMIYDRAGLVTDALNGSLTGSAIAQHIAETHIDVGTELLKNDLHKGMVGIAKTMIKAQVALQDVLVDVKAQSGAGAGNLSAKRTLLRQATIARGKIAEMEEALSACGLR